MKIDKQLLYLIGIYLIATICTFALDWQLPGFQQIASFSKTIDLDRYLIPDYMTYWQLTHFLTRVFLGYFSPKYWQIIFLVDFGWETMEWYQWPGAENWFDLVWNMLGLITGMMLRHYGLFEKYFGKLDETAKVDKNTQEQVLESSANNTLKSDKRNEGEVVPTDKQKDVGGGLSQPRYDIVGVNESPSDVTRERVKSRSPMGIKSPPPAVIRSPGGASAAAGGSNSEPTRSQMKSPVISQSAIDNSYYFMKHERGGVHVNDGASLITTPLKKREKRRKKDKDRR